jgi:hypothetical protein
MELFASLLLCVFANFFSVRTIFMLHVMGYIFAIPFIIATWGYVLLFLVPLSIISYAYCITCKFVGGLIVSFFRKGLPASGQQVERRKQRERRRSSEYDF